MTSTNSRWVQGSFLAALLLTFVILLPTKPPVFLRVPPTLPSKIIAPRGCQDLSQSKLQPRENAAIVLLLRENG